MKLKILQWNVWTKEKPKHIVQEIKRLDPDIVCAQEFIQLSSQNIDTAKEIAQLVDYDYYFKAAETWTTMGEKKTQGNAIFSKNPIINSNFSYVQQPVHNPPNAAEEGRVYIESTVKFDDKSLTFGTTHLSYTDQFQITPGRKKEAENLLSLLKQKQTNFIFTGDLNAIPESSIIRDIDSILKHTGPEYNQNTFTNKPFNYHGFKVDDLSFRLDYVFTTPDIKVIDSQIIQTDHSDHLPILTTIEI